MTSMRAALLGALLIACSSTPSRTASCQQLSDCCHGNPDCDPIVDQNDPGACQTQLVVERGSGHCSDAGSTPTDGGATGILACMGMVGTLPVCAEANGEGFPSTCGTSATMVASCPTDAVGGCVIIVDDAGVMGTETLHFYPPATAMQIETLCMMLGGH